MKKIKTRLPQAIAILIMFVLSMSLTSITKARDNNNDKVKICHRTNSFSNPYRNIEVSSNAVDGQGNSDHTSHTGPVFDPNTMNQHSDWGDIIPSHPGNSLNWNTAGQAIYNNGCAVVQPTPVSPSISTVISGTTINIKEPKITPQVLGTSVMGIKELPAAGVDFSWIYYFVLTASLFSIYYLKQIGWAKITR